jgi:predicted ATPase
MVSLPVDDLSKSIRALKSKAPHIHSLRFPNYRNLEPNAELIFGFPITVLLGCNGANKSSILHALYGSVRGKSIGDFWFETKLDAIKEIKNGLRQSVVHRYLNDKKELVECLKIRYFREGNPDYWEPAKHRKIYGFEETDIRIPPVQLHVRHFDFRGELPAFDKYFYFPDPKHLERRNRERKKADDITRSIKYSKQDYLRSRSALLKKQIEQRGESLSPQELKIIRYILDRDYVSGKVLKHNLFHGHEGWSILFETDTLNDYSDAFAGSGESAATLLVHNIFHAPDNSLILLDEPETSLHPRAQQRMLEFLAHQTVRKSLQVVIATHSIHLAEKLPQEAIRVLQHEASGKISIESSLSAKEALHEIGIFPPGKTILVEDERAKLVISEVLKVISDRASQEFNVVVQHGGTSKIYRDIRAFSNSERKEIFIVFDGDHNPDCSIPESGDLPQGEPELMSLIANITKGNNSTGPDVKKKIGLENTNEMTRYINYFKKFVRFLPAKTPEHLIWDDLEAQELLRFTGKELSQDILQEKSYKKKLALLAEQIPGMQADAIFQLLLAKLLNSNKPWKNKIFETINEIRSLANE